ncbi:TRIM69 [Mytilus coruscus]|uniref:TRIM69 n=1 Tax=Mytilus coruscus TaxID=42192 RepID=A0A6J8C002_MYTCO|nr:TRIM69 [Mytilus coruscus]
MKQSKRKAKSTKTSIERRKVNKKSDQSEESRHRVNPHIITVTGEVRYSCLFTMASSTPVCSICDLRNITKPSIIWCFECDEGLCPECKDHHRLSKGTRNHNTVTISEYQKLPSEIVKITQNCAKHSEKFTIYCKKHECLCCGSCTVENHIECRDFDKLADIFQTTTFSNAFYEIEQSLADLSNNIQKIQNVRKDNLMRFAEKKRQIEQEIKQTRIAINTHLDKIQDDIMNKLNETVEKESKFINEQLELLKEKGSEITDYRKTIENIKQHATDLQTFIWMKELENEISSNDEFLQSVIDSTNFKDCELSYKTNAAMQNIANQMKNFGEVII